MLQMRRWKYKDIKKPAQGNTASWWQSQDSNPNSLAVEHILNLTTYVHNTNGL